MLTVEARASADLEGLNLRQKGLKKGDEGRARGDGQRWQRKTEKGRGEQN